MTSIFREDIINEEFLQKVLAQHLKKDFKLLEFKSLMGSGKGDNYMGDLASVEIKVLIGDSEEKNLHWMIKLLKPDPANGGQHLGRMMKAIDREGALYYEIMPEINKIGNLEYCPLVYLDMTPGKEALVLEHMKPLGWRDAVNKKDGLTLEHVNLVVEWLAKFHGLSYVLMQNYPGGPEAWQSDHPWSVTLSQNPPPFMKVFNEIMKEEHRRKLMIIAEMLNTDEDKKNDYVKHVQNFLDSGLAVSDLRRKAQALTLPFCTLNHLDPWFNNMLFHYNEDGSPEKVLLLDFQLVGTTTPGNDLTYFLLTSTTPQFRSKHFSSVMEAYHKTLHKTVKDAGLSDFKYTMFDLLEDYKKGLNSGPMLTVMALQLMFYEPGVEDSVEFGTFDVTDSNALKEFGKQTTQSTELSMLSNKSMRNRIRGIFDDVIEAKIW